MIQDKRKHPNLSEGALPVWDLRLANSLSYALNPFFLAPLLLAAILQHFGASGAETARVLTVGVIFFVLIPFAFIVWMLRQGRIETLEIRRRSRRTLPFSIGITSYVAALFALKAAAMTAAALLAGIAACIAFNTLLILLINLRWKISVHTSALAGFVSMLFFVAHTSWPEITQPSGLSLLNAGVYGLLPLVPALMWARVRVGAHTPLQVTAGAVFGFVAPPVELYLLLNAGLLYGS